MTNVVHVIDRSCGPEALLEASLLAGADDRLLCLGPPPERDALPTGPPAGPPLRTVSLSRLQLRGGRLLEDLLAGEVVCQCWSVQAAWAIAGVLGDSPAPLVLRPTAPPGREETGKLLELTRARQLALACPTEFAALRLRAALPVEVRVIFPPAQALDIGRPERSRLREALGVGADEVLIAAPGPVRLRSGHRYAVWGMAVLVVAELPLRMILQKSGPRARAVAEFARRPGFGDQTLLSEAPLPEVIAAADVAAFLDEDFPPPLALAAAMSAGLPIVAAETPAAGEWLRHRQNALLVPPRNPRAVARALMRLIEEKDLPGRLGEAARSFAEARFQAGSVRRQWARLHVDLLAARGPACPSAAAVETRTPADL